MLLEFHLISYVIEHIKIVIKLDTGKFRSVDTSDLHNFCLVTKLIADPYVFFTKGWEQDISKNAKNKEI